MNDYSLLNKKLDPTSSLWKKKYTLLLKRAENIEKQNLRLINRIYHGRRIHKRLSKEKRFLMHRLDRHHDDYKSSNFFKRLEILPERPIDNQSIRTSNKMKTKVNACIARPKKKKKTNKMPVLSIKNSTKEALPKKPLNAFLRYCQAMREVVLQENVGISNQDLTKELSKKWNALDERGKQVYYGMFDEDRLRYDKELQEFKKRKEMKKSEDKEQK